jgi:hypothetical protein
MATLTLMRIILHDEGMARMQLDSAGYDRGMMDYRFN